MGYYYNLFEMTSKKVSAATTIKKPQMLVGIDIPIIEQNGQMLISAILLHQKLKANTRFNDWIKSKIDRFGFEKNQDYFTEISVKLTVGRKATDYLLTLDMGKELAMLEENEIGRKIRRYFIEIEKRYRDWIGFILPRLEISYDLFGQQEGYKYNDLLKACGASLKSGSKSARVRKNKQDFFRDKQKELCVYENFGKTIITNTIARTLNAETKQRRLTYQADLLQEGGTHA